MTEELKTVLEDKENELCLAKEKAVQEYRDSDALLTKLGVSYNDGFDDTLCQAKALYPKLDFSTVNINVAEATSVQPDASDDINELFAEEGPVTVIPEVQAEEEKSHEAKNPVVPDVQTFNYLLFLSFFLEQLDFARCMLGHFVICCIDV